MGARGDARGRRGKFYTRWGNKHSLLRVLKLGWEKRATITRRGKSGVAERSGAGRCGVVWSGVGSGLGLGCGKEGAARGVARPWACGLIKTGQFGVWRNYFIKIFFLGTHLGGGDCGAV